MARARRPRTPTPGQLTLEDWAEIRKASLPAPSTPPREGGDVYPALSASAAENGAELRSTSEAIGTPVPHHPVTRELLETPGALLTRTHLRELGLERRAIDAVFRKLPVVALPGYSRPMIHVEEYLGLIDEHTYRDDRVRSS